jgi:hypothetical protein
VGFVLRVLAGWFLVSQGDGGRDEARAQGPASDHLEEARRQLAALDKALAAESEEA